MPEPFSPPLDISEIEQLLTGVRVERILGVGGQGVAAKVDTDAYGVAALKIYGPTTVAARVDREIDKLKRLRSDYVVRLFDHGVVDIRGDSCRYALLEFVDGVELTNLVGNLSDSDADIEVRRLLCDIALGIGDLWSLRVVHRDIKPANIMRRSDGRYLILDLGLAKHLDESTVTQVGFTCGTLGYMSPEQAAARRGLTLRSDLFALGIVAHEVATGHHPFHRRQELVGKLGIRRLRDVRPAISNEVSELVARLLQVHPLSRPSRVHDIVSGLT